MPVNLGEATAMDLTEDIEDRLHGGCVPVAIALSRRHGLRLVAFWNEFADECEVAEGCPGALVHVMALIEDGNDPEILDAAGCRRVSEAALDYGGSYEEFLMTIISEVDLEHFGKTDADEIIEAEVWIDSVGIRPGCGDLRTTSSPIC